MIGTKVMNADVHDHVCVLLLDTLDLLDEQGATMAAIHVSHALEVLGCAVTDPADRPAAAV
ncbi:hypothetical protein [Sphingomonas sp. Leaf37]|uniref:hypothetical protein n=1 Tax=Sphingomonas sp. Leaf37 TaxID=2876552 RepID=UPI001E41946C|nr:hypothetical protein [Sphingomonas sp. Leaf37]